MRNYLYTIYFGLTSSNSMRSNYLNSRGFGINEVISSQIDSNQCDIIYITI
jgi:hypothetical protein